MSDPEDAPVSGIVSGVTVYPGRSDVRVHVVGYERGQFLKDGGRVTLDGTAITLPQLVSILPAATAGMTVTLHPLVEHYGAALDAEFVAATS